MKPVIIRNLKIGQGMPKICVPITGVKKDDIIADAKALKCLPADMVEWRVDWFEHAYNINQILSVLQELRVVLEDLPLLMTFRTSNEGGEKTITPEEYASINISAITSGCIDMVDVEAFSEKKSVAEIIDAAHANHVKVIASNHDFYTTPSKDEIIARLRKMQDMNADIAKIAVMPQCKEDVITLLAATEEMHSHYARCPIVTMSMGKLGAISRLCGEFFGSAITFGIAHKSSAPGQIEANALHHILHHMHDNEICD